MATILASAIVSASSLHGEAASSDSTIYDPDPKHLWNRLNETLFLRTAQDGKRYGLDELDILFWFGTKHVLLGPSHRQALALLDEFISSHGEKLVSDPLKRALLQRDLWELFDWAAKPFRRAEDAPACRELQSRLVVLIRRLALTTDEIASLPDNYAQAETSKLPDLPLGLFQTNGVWLNVGVNGYNPVPVAPTHLSSFDGHSAFGVLLRMPGGRRFAISYLDRLRSFAQSEHVWIYQTNRFAWRSANEPKEILALNPNLPQFPPGTEWALVRRMCVIDVDGCIQPTSITESIQLRRYLDPKKRIPDPSFSTNVVQQFFEFQLGKLHAASLRAVGRDEKGFPFVHFRGKGIDLFEWSSGNLSDEQQTRDSSKLQTKVLGTCYQCHSAPGIFSVLSYTGFLSPPPAQQPTDLAPIDFSREATATIHWKQQEFDWGLLQGLWRQAK